MNYHATMFSDEHVEKLLKIAVDGVKERLRHWSTLGFKINHYFSLDEQLGAIAKLGFSRNSRALRCLHDLLEFEVRHEVLYDSDNSMGNADHDLNHLDSVDLYRRVHPNAHGELGDALNASVDSPENTPWSSKYIRAHDTIQSAVTQLESSLSFDTEICAR